MKVNLYGHPGKARNVAMKLSETLKKGGIFKQKELPDDLVKSISDIDEELYINFISLTTALDYMRDARRLWNSAIQTLNDKEASWIFTPEQVSTRSINDLIAAMLKYGLAVRKDKDSKIWYTISKSLTEKFNGSFIELFSYFNFDAYRMFIEFDRKDNKELFPSISGRKIFPHWMRILAEKTGIKMANLEKLPIPVDVHVARATFTTGCITGTYRSKNIGNTLRKRIIDIWYKALEGTDIIPIQMFRPLWILSKRGCHYRNGRNRPKYEACPVKEMCADGIVNISARNVEIETNQGKKQKLRGI